MVASAGFHYISSRAAALAGVGQGRRFRNPCSMLTCESNRGPGTRAMKSRRPAIAGIDHVQIAAPPGCEEQARRFFGQLLGLEEVEKPEPLRSRGGCWFNLGSGQLHIGVEKDFQPARKAHPAFAVNDLEGLFEILSKAGVRCAKDDSLAGIRRFYAEDPWGNRLEFTESNP